MQAPPGLQMLTLRSRPHRHPLHCPLLRHQRRFKLQRPHPGDIRPGWDLGPVLQSIRDPAKGPHLSSGPEHQARRSLRDLSPSRRLLQLIRVHRPSYHQRRGSGAPCSPAIRFQGTWICVPETSLGSHTMTSVLTADQRFKDSTRLIRQYSL